VAPRSDRDVVGLDVLAIGSWRRPTTWIEISTDSSAATRTQEGLAENRHPPPERADDEKRSSMAVGTSR
jgi:hypothetical protein